MFRVEPDGPGKLVINEDALDKLQALRTTLGTPMIVNSGYRSKEHNKRVGGAPLSMHLEGKAFDISMANHDPASFIAAARAAGFRGIGTYPRSNFIHIDTGPTRAWGDPFAVRASRFAPDAAPARESLADSRTLKGGSAAGLGTVGAAGVEVVQNALNEAQSAIQPVIPYLDSFRWVFVALALGGIAVAIYARFDDWKRGQRCPLLAALWQRALPWLALGAAILLVILGARRSSEKVGRATERLQNTERTIDALQRMLEAGADRPRDRDDLIERLRKGGF